MFAGADTDIFPGLGITDWWRKNTNLSWLGYYLAPAPSHQDTSWMGRRAALVAQNWGLLPIFVGQQMTGGPGSHIVSADQGAADGLETIKLLTQEEFPPGTKVVLDLERPNTWDFWAPYVSAWADAVQAACFHPCVYGGHTMGAALRAGLLNAAIDAPYIWAVKVERLPQGPVAAPYPTTDPAGSGVANAYAWQWAQGAEIEDGTGKPRLVDLSTSIFADPGAP